MHHELDRGLDDVLLSYGAYRVVNKVEREQLLLHCAGLRASCGCADAQQCVRNEQGSKTSVSHAAA